MVRITRGMAARMDPEREPEQTVKPQQPAPTSASTNLTVPIMENTFKPDSTTIDVLGPDPAVADGIQPDSEPQPEPAPIVPSGPKRKRIRTEKLKARRAAYNRKKRQHVLAEIMANPSATGSSSLRAGRPQSFKALQKLFLKQQQEIKHLKKQAAKSAAATPHDGTHAGQTWRVLDA